MGKVTLYHNATIRTVDERWPTVQWFTVTDGKFQRVGNGPHPAVRDKDCIDLQGRTVVPGFIDAHAHFFQTGIDLLQIDLSTVTTRKQLREKLLDEAPKKGWIFANSFEEDKLTDAEQITCHDLDEIADSRPIWLNRVDYHSAVANSRALKRLSVPRHTQGLLTDDTGKPNGILRSGAYMHAKQRISQLYSIELKERAVKAAVHEMLRQGITAVHALEGGSIFGDDGVPVILRRMHKLPLYFTLFLQEKNVYITSRFGFDHLGGCILIDGSIGSYTAALDFDYAGPEGGRGYLYEKTRAFQSFVDEAHQAGVQLAFHAIGPRAIQMVLDAYDRALARNPRFDHRHRIEHFELATDEQIQQASDLGLVISMQPSFEYFWGGPDGMYAHRLGERWNQTNRLKSILDAGVTISGGSDTHVTPANPLLGIHAAVNHPNPDQRITPEQALKMMTLDAAYGAFNEDKHGSITPGKRANFTILDRDLANGDAASIKDIHVDATYYRGRRVFERKQRVIVDEMERSPGDIEDEE